MECNFAAWRIYTFSNKLSVMFHSPVMKAILNNQHLLRSLINKLVVYYALKCRIPPLRQKNPLEMNT